MIGQRFAMWVSAACVLNTATAEGEGLSPMLEDAPASAEVQIILDSEVLERATADHRDSLSRAIASTRENRPPRAGKERLMRTGEWQSQRFEPESRGWQVDIEQGPKTGSVEGTIRIHGSRSLTAATKMRGWMDGNSVMGTIATDHGDVLGTFSGAVSASGMAGT